ncbi:hypothetical protein GQ457_13G014550 [Hibiscus cannabinus]
MATGETTNITPSLLQPINENNKERVRRKSRNEYHGLKLAVPPEMQQNPCLELNNGDSSSAPMLQHRVTHHPSWNTAVSLPSQSLYLHTCTSPPNNTFLKQYQSSTNKKAGNQLPCNNAD